MKQALGEFSSSLDSKLEFWVFQYHYSFLSCALFLGLLELMDPLSGLDSHLVAVLSSLLLEPRALNCTCCNSGSPLGAPCGTNPKQVNLGVWAFVTEELWVGTGKVAASASLPLSYSEISHLEMYMVGFHSRHCPFTCLQLCAAPLDENGNSGSAVFHLQEETHFWHSLSSNTSLVSTLNVWSFPS